MTTTPRPDTSTGPHAPDRAPTRRSRAARRVGYAVAVLLNGVLLLLIHVWPGWEAVPFLTGATTEVLPIVDVSIVVSMVVNLVYIAADPRWLRALGDAVTAGVSALVLVRLLQVFPFTFADEPWAWAVRFGLVFGIVVTVIGALVALARFLSAALSGGGRAHPA